MKYTIQKANELFDILYGHGIFLPPDAAVKAGSAAFNVCDSFLQKCDTNSCKHISKLINLIWFSTEIMSLEDSWSVPPRNSNSSKEGYLQLAASSHRKGMFLFKVRPKTHMLAEIGIQMLELGMRNRLALSPICTCTWTDEDYIGRVSRTARAGHGATISVTTMKKTLGMYSLQMKHLLATKKRSWVQQGHRENRLVDVCVGRERVEGSK